MVILRGGVVTTEEGDLTSKLSFNNSVSEYVRNTCHIQYITLTLAEKCIVVLFIHHIILN